MDVTIRKTTQGMNYRNSPLPWPLSTSGEGKNKVRGEAKVATQA
jgi:hypothetical protein